MRNILSLLKSFAVVGLILGSTLLINLSIASAANTATTLTVLNASPEFSVAPAEQPASYGATSGEGALEAGNSLLFQAIATDTLDDYYLIICRSNTVNPGNNSAPTCSSEADRYCVSYSTTSGVTASCSYTVQSADNATQHSWYAFVCDKVVDGGSCSSANLGSGNSGSPFYVKDSSNNFHPPTPTPTSSVIPTEPVLDNTIEEESKLQILSVKIDDIQVGNDIIFSFNTMNWGQTTVKPSRIEIEIQTPADIHYSYHIIEEIEEIGDFSEKAQDIIIPSKDMEVGDYQALITIYDEKNNLLYSNKLEFSILEKGSLQDPAVTEAPSEGQGFNLLDYWVYIVIASLLMLFVIIILVYFRNRKNDSSNLPPLSPPLKI